VNEDAAGEELRLALDRQIVDVAISVRLYADD
jgi:hypothetical protein